MVPKSLSNSSIGPKTMNRGTGHDEQIIANNWEKHRYLSVL